MRQSRTIDCHAGTFPGAVPLPAFRRPSNIESVRTAPLSSGLSVAVGCRRMGESFAGFVAAYARGGGPAHRAATPRRMSAQLRTISIHGERCSARRAHAEGARACTDDRRRRRRRLRTSRRPRLVSLQVTVCQRPSSTNLPVVSIDTVWGRSRKGRVGAFAPPGVDLPGWTRCLETRPPTFQRKTREK